MTLIPIAKRIPREQMEVIKRQQAALLHFNSLENSTWKDAWEDFYRDVLKQITHAEREPFSIRESRTLNYRTDLYNAWSIIEYENTRYTDLWLPEMQQTLDDLWAEQFERERKYFLRDVENMRAAQTLAETLPEPKETIQNLGVFETDNLLRAIKTAKKAAATVIPVKTEGYSKVQRIRLEFNRNGVRITPLDELANPITDEMQVLWNNTRLYDKTETVIVLSANQLTNQGKSAGILDIRDNASDEQYVRLQLIDGKFLRVSIGAFSFTLKKLVGVQIK